jgi:hypothetical protein
MELDRLTRWKIPRFVYELPQDFNQNPVDITVIPLDKPDAKDSGKIKTLTFCGLMAIHYTCYLFLENTKNPL